MKENDCYLTTKLQELQWAKKNNKPMLIQVLTKLIEKEVKPNTQLKLFI